MASSQQFTVIQIVLVVSSVLINLTWGHVALTYPPARKYDLDFLDNSRTPGPCGMPSGLDGKLRFFFYFSTFANNFSFSKNVEWMIF